MRLAVLLSAAASALVLAACAPDAPAPAEPEAAPAAAEVPEEKPLHVAVLDCGTIAISDLDAFSSAGDYAGQADEFTDTCYLVHHP
ncbi:MAG: N-acyl homoserine lactonase family protein, partial [Hyphomonas sp.]|nr:N-acyl homoserine lactonase family protein [Hyphomonas sp.]